MSSYLVQLDHLRIDINGLGKNINGPTHTVKTEVYMGH